MFIFILANAPETWPFCRILIREGGRELGRQSAGPLPSWAPGVPRFFWAFFRVKNITFGWQNADFLVGACWLLEFQSDESDESDESDG